MKLEKSEDKEKYKKYTYGPFTIGLHKSPIDKNWLGIIGPGKYGKWQVKLGGRYFTATDKNVSKYIDEVLPKRGREVLEKLFSVGL